MEEKDAQSRRRSLLQGTLVSKPVSRGEIYLIDVTEDERTPQAGENQPVIVCGSYSEKEKRKQRPIVIVSRDDLNKGDYVTAVPFYSQQLEKRKGHRSAVFFEAGAYGLDRDCVAKCDEVSQIEKAELPLRRGPIGRVPEEKMQLIVDAIRFCLRDSTLGNK